MSNSSEKAKKLSEKELEELAKLTKELPVKKIRDPDQVRTPEEVKMKLHDYRFYISLIMVVGFLVLLGIPLVRSQEDLLKTIASILAGPVGAVIGYYFGVRKGEET